MALTKRMLGLLSMQGCLLVLMSTTSSVAELAVMDCFLHVLCIISNYIGKNMLLKMFIRQSRVGHQIDAINDLINYLEDPV